MVDDPKTPTPPKTGAATPNTGAPAAPGAPVAPTRGPSNAAAPGNVDATKVASDGFTNPALVDAPGTTRNLTPPDENTNPAAAQGLGAAAPNPEPGVVQTTIDGETTTIHPKATINNRVEPATATLKGASNKEKK